MRLADAALQASSWVSSRAYWGHIGRTVDRLEIVNAVIMGGVEGLENTNTTPSGKALIPDPTAVQAMKHQLALRQLEALEVERGELLEAIGASLVLIEAIRGILGHKYADVLEMRYIDRFKWPIVAAEMGITAVHAHRLESIVHDWIDAHGWGALITGKGKAEK